MDSDEQQLVDAARAGEPEAAGQLVELFYERIYAFLRRLTRNDADAADLTQRAFGRIWQALPSYAGRSSVSSWMHGIAYHVYVDWRRSNHHTEARPADWWDACPGPQASPADLAADADLARTLYRSVGRLDAELSEPVHLHYFQGLTLEETAGAMGLAASTIKYRLRQAVAELRKMVVAEPVAPKLATRNL